MKRRHVVIFTLILIALLVSSANLNTGGVTQASGTGRGANQLLVDDFEDGDKFSSFKTAWSMITDNQRGGTSTASINIVKGGGGGSQRSLQVSGKVTTAFQYGYAGVGVKLNQERDVTGYSGIRFYTRGDGGTYRVNVASSSIPGGDQYGRDFIAPAVWTLVKIPFSQMGQQGFGTKAEWTGRNINRIVFLTLRQPLDSYRLQLDQIMFY